MCFIQQETLPDWKDKFDVLAALRACSYNPHQCIATYLDWGDTSMSGHCLFLIVIIIIITINNLMTRALVSVVVYAAKEPFGLIHRHGRCPDVMTQIPWRSEKLLVWDVTVVSTLADSYDTTTMRRLAELATVRKGKE